ncbi:MAG TPA: GAF domain-containing protein [Burkholderiaceae bacterium]|nr:GAF domain-containing protein [Burkholderiaceae bacterium]
MLGQDMVAIIIGLGLTTALAQAGLCAWRWQVQRRNLVQIGRLNDLLRSLSRANRMILRTQSEEALWQEACDICVSTGKAVLACLYVRDGMLIHRVVTAGPAARVLANVPLTLDMNAPEVRGSYTAQSLLEGDRLVSNDYVLDPRAGRWREEAVRQGVRAIAWVPVRRAGRVVATLMLCADQRDYFDAELLQSLDELGEDLSYALESIDRNAQQRAAQRELEAGRDRFRALFERAPVPMAILSIAERRILEVNEAMCAWHGMSRADIIGSITASLARGLVEQDRDQFYRTLNAEGRVSNLMLTVRDAQGREHQEVFSAQPMDYLGQACCLVTCFNPQGMEVQGRSEGQGDPASLSGGVSGA